MKIAFVTPWYGRDIPGGAEAETRRTAVHLAHAGFQVEVLTTCIRDFYADWGHNAHKPGTEQIDGVLVRRFPVQKRNKALFDQLNGRLLQNQPLTPQEESQFHDEMIRCPALYDYIRQQQNDYLFIFIPYMFATTVWGAQIAPQRSAMIPCLHDEPYLRLSSHQQTIPQVRALFLHVHAEKALADARFPQPDGQIRQVIGEGVDTELVGDGARFRQKYGLNETPFVLYAGRRESGKNTPLLLRYWSQYANRHGAKLVLIGSGAVQMPPQTAVSILDLGFVSAQDKADAYAAANVFCMPSVHESFSIVLMESWLAQTPVLVHGDCAVTKEHCVQANGGLYFTNAAEFAATLDYLLTHPTEAARMGQQGRRYVLAHYQWPDVIGRYTAVLQQMMRDA